VSVRENQSVQKYLLHFFVLGVIVGSVLFNFSADINTVWLFYIFSIALFAIGLLKNNRLALFLAFSVLMSASTLWIGLSKFPPAEIPRLFTENSSASYTFTGEIAAEPDIRETTTRLIVEIDDISGRHAKSSEKIILVVGHYPKRNIGDRLEFTGKLQLPENFLNENGIEFDYVNYLAKDRIYSMMYRPRITVLEENSGGILNKIFTIKNSFLEKVQTVMPSPESELLGGILLGTKRSLGADLEEKFRRVGLIHIVVLSGYNITIIAEAIFRFFGFLPKLFSVTLSVISIIIFAVMVGSGATIVRATVMTLLALTARISGRTYGVNRALFLAAGIMIMHNPMILLKSFCDSFLKNLNCVKFRPQHWQPNYQSCLC
jgi:competence protein ComEC